MQDSLTRTIYIFSHLRGFFWTKDIKLNVQLLFWASKSLGNFHGKKDCCAPISLSYKDKTLISSKIKRNLALFPPDIKPWDPLSLEVSIILKWEVAPLLHTQEMLLLWRPLLAAESVYFSHRTAVLLWALLTRVWAGGLHTQMGCLVRAFGTLQVQDFISHPNLWLVVFLPGIQQHTTTENHLVDKEFKSLMTFFWCLPSVYMVITMAACILFTGHSLNIKFLEWYSREDNTPVSNLFSALCGKLSYFGNCL